MFGRTSYGSVWRKNVINCCLMFSLWYQEKCGFGLARTVAGLLSNAIIKCFKSLSVKAPAEQGVFSWH